MDFKKLPRIPVGADLSRPAPIYRPSVAVRYPDEKAKVHCRASQNRLCSYSHTYRACYA